MERKVSELSLLVWLSRGHKQDLIQLMCNYTGCRPEDYSDRHLKQLMQHCIQDITQKYHILGLWWHYFDAQNMYSTYAEIHNEPYSELDPLEATIMYIKPAVFDEEDKTRIEKLEQEYGKKLR